MIFWWWLGSFNDSEWNAAANSKTSKEAAWVKALRFHTRLYTDSWRARVCRIIQRSLALTHQSLFTVTQSTEVNDRRGGHRSTPPGPKELQTVWGPQQLVRRSTRSRPHSRQWIPPSTATLQTAVVCSAQWCRTSCPWSRWSLRCTSSRWNSSNFQPIDSAKSSQLPCKVNFSLCSLTAKCINGFSRFLRFDTSSANIGMRLLVLRQTPWSSLHAPHSQPFEYLQSRNVLVIFLSSQGRVSFTFTLTFMFSLTEDPHVVTCLLEILEISK